MKRREVTPQDSTSRDTVSKVGAAGNPGVASLMDTASMPWVPMPECLSRWTGFVLCWVSNLGSQFFEATLAPLHLRPGQLGILSLLESEGAMVQARLSERLRIDKATMVSLLNDLQQQGLIERRPHLTDRRAFEIHLLESGRQRIQQAEQVGEIASQRFFGVLSPEEQQTLHHLLVRLATSSAALMPPATYISEDTSDSDGSP
jgi:MarR family transcriptional regulator, lower aerobic nicotinate degradation pathway regulator